MKLKTISFMATDNIVDALTDLLDEIKILLSGENIVTVIVDPSNPQGEFLPNTEIVIYNGSAISDIKVDDVPLDYEEEEFDEEVSTTGEEENKIVDEEENEEILEEGCDNQKTSIKPISFLKLKIRKQSK